MEIMGTENSSQPSPWHHHKLGTRMHLTNDPLCRLPVNSAQNRRRPFYILIQYIAIEPLFEQAYEANKVLLEKTLCF
jgi:hypothetical protein